MQRWKTLGWRPDIRGTKSLPMTFRISRKKAIRAVFPLWFSSFPFLCSLAVNYLAPHHEDPISVQVNGIDLRKATHDEAINVLRQTPQRVRLTLYRDEAPYREEDVCDAVTVELQKKPGKGLGLSIVGKRCA